MLVRTPDWEESAILMNIRNQAQVIEMYAPYNAFWTKKNFKLSRHHPVPDKFLELNFVSRGGDRRFPDHWARILPEIRVSSENGYYAWQKFGFDGLKEKFWTYRMGKGIEHNEGLHPEDVKA